MPRLGPMHRSRKEMATIDIMNVEEPTCFAQASLNFFFFISIHFLRLLPSEFEARDLQTLYYDD